MEGILDELSFCNRGLCGNSFRNINYLRMNNISASLVSFARYFLGTATNKIK